MRVLFTGVGTRGDLHVLVKPALELAARGHQVVVSAPEEFAAWITAAGLTFCPNMPSSADSIAGKRGVEGVLFALRDQADALLSRTLSAAKGAALVVASGPHPAAFSAAQLLDVPYVYVTFSPVYVRSSYHAPLGRRAWPLRAANRVHWWAQERLFQTVFGRAANAARAAQGLAPVQSLLYEQACAGGIIYAFDPDFEPIGPDIEGRGIVVGPLAYSEDPPLPPELEAFLSAGAPPLFVGFGSMREVGREHVLELVESAARRLRIRAIVATGAFSVRSDRVATVGHVSHSRLLPRMSGVIHHGGSGTTYSAYAAGVPQAIVAHRGDQFWYGRCVATKGIGPPPSSVGKLSPRVLERLLAELAHGESYRLRAAECRTAANRFSDGAARAADYLERVARSAA